MNAPSVNDLDHRRALRRFAPIALPILLCSAFLCAGTWSAYHAGNRNDQYQLIQLGQCVLDGRLLYVNCWENKPPGVAWISAIGMALTAGNQFGAWIMPGLWGSLCLSIFWVSVRRLYGLAVAGVATCIAAIVFSLRL
ncbi:MAG: glycosyltransferase family 39 protein, partial [Planctomycetota bacterium]